MESLTSFSDTSSERSSSKDVLRRAADLGETAAVVGDVLKGMLEDGLSPLPVERLDFVWRQELVFLQLIEIAPRTGLDQLVFEEEKFFLEIGNE